KKDEVGLAADISRIFLSDKEKDEITEELNAIMNYMEKLDEINLDNVEPIVHMAPAKNVLREDKVWQSLDRDEALKNALDKDNGFFRVPRIIEE
ncbi:MAG: Asp-tRNA(Asn)/Glu-tRNA(Gln) amidotransferase subunit GatC, partial [Thermoanaerobacterales bacterium]|nr:Asp-tRNA(Asn)/Glu-tRNA(Gln) amidotransferase subunit GatC [Thermoanaerobacterales bacterium]